MPPKVVQNSQNIMYSLRSHYVPRYARHYVFTVVHIITIRLDVIFTYFASTEQNIHNAPKGVWHHALACIFLRIDAMQGIVLAFLFIRVGALFWLCKSN